MSINTAVVEDPKTTPKPKLTTSTDFNPSLLNANSLKPSRDNLPRLISTSISGNHQHDSDDDEHPVEVEHQADGSMVGNHAHSHSSNLLGKRDSKQSGSTRTHLGDELTRRKASRFSGVKLLSNSQKSQVAAPTQARINSEKRARKTTVTLWIVCCVFVGLNIPNAAIRFLKGYTSLVVNPRLNDISLVLYTISFAVNPFIYYFTNSAFKTDLITLIPCLKCGSNMHEGN